jgi:hypothetical protein
MAVDLKDEEIFLVQRLLKDVLWRSDPDANGSRIKDNPRGCGVAFGPEIVGEVLELVLGSRSSTNVTWLRKFEMQC